MRRRICRGKQCFMRRADLVLLDRDVLTISPEEMRETKVVWTMVAGRVVYRAK
jgi:predicted amidohydrolase YtcJ